MAGSAQAGWFDWDSKAQDKAAAAAQAAQPADPKTAPAGNLDNDIVVGGTDETGQLLNSLAGMQTALRARDEKDADFRGQIAAIHRSQAVIEFGLDGTILAVNGNFESATGYASGEVVGKHHSMFLEPAVAAGAEYRSIWDKLRRGEPVVGTFKRLAKGGREVWMQASYSPIADISGKPFKPLGAGGMWTCASSVNVSVTPGCDWRASNERDSAARASRYCSRCSSS